MLSEPQGLVREAHALYSVPQGHNDCGKEDWEQSMPLVHVTGLGWLCVLLLLGKALEP